MGIVESWKMYLMHCFIINTKKYKENNNHDKNTMQVKKSF